LLTALSPPEPLDNDDFADRLKVGLAVFVEPKTILAVKARTRAPTPPKLTTRFMIELLLVFHPSPRHLIGFEQFAVAYTKIITSHRDDPSPFFK
jgi:hypothetical protein